MRSFDQIARIYDFLANVIFGREWKSVQSAPVVFLSNVQNILIVGGGSGQLLERLTGMVTYVELSDKMLAKANARIRACEVDFVKADFLKWSTDQKFDAIVFPFFLDCFGEAHLKKIITKSGDLLEHNGQIIVLDFQKAVWWKNFLVKVMYIFFRLVSGLEARQIQDFKYHLENAGYQESSRREYLRGWVFCGRYHLGN